MFIVGRGLCIAYTCIETTPVFVDTPCSRLSPSTIQHTLSHTRTQDVVVQGNEGSVGDLLSEQVACNGVLWITNGVLLPGTNFTDFPVIPRNTLTVEDIGNAALV